jgi:hypothetical protein
MRCSVKKSNRAYPLRIEDEDDDEDEYDRLPCAS